MGKYGGEVSLNCYALSMVSRALAEKPATVVKANSLIREHLHRMAAAGKVFDFYQEAERVSDKYFDRARREFSPQQGKQQAIYTKGKANNPPKDPLKGAGKGKNARKGGWGEKQPATHLQGAKPQQS